MLNHTLSATFKLQGNWWLPADPDHRIRGTLSYVPGEWIELELYGAFHNPHSLLENPDRSYELILGITADGQSCTLLDNYLRGGSWSFNNPEATSVQRYQVTYLFHNAHFSAVEDIKFLRLAVMLDAYTRSVRGWALSRTIDQHLTLTALRMALANGRPAIFHSDQGVQ